MAELVDALDLGSSTARCGGSSPSIRTKFTIFISIFTKSLGLSMNITEIKNDKTDFHVKVTIPSKEISSEIEKELARLAKIPLLDRGPEL